MSSTDIIATLLGQLEASRKQAELLSHQLELSHQAKTASDSNVAQLITDIDKLVEVIDCYTEILAGQKDSISKISSRLDIGEEKIRSIEQTLEALSRAINTVEQVRRDVDELDQCKDELEGSLRKLSDWHLVASEQIKSLTGLSSMVRDVRDQQLENKKPQTLLWGAITTAFAALVAAVLSGVIQK